MAKLEVVLHENTSITKDSAPYIGNLVSKGNLNLEAFSSQTSEQCGLPPIQLEAMYVGMFDEIAKLQKEGPVRVNLGDICVCQVIKGKFDSSDAKFDPEKNSLELAIRLSDDIRNSLANETPKIVTDETSTKVRLDTVADVETPRPYQLIHGTKPFLCTGINLVTTDVGAEVYLENAIGTKFPCVVDEVVSKQEFTAHLSAAVEPGDYKLVVKSRGGDAEGQLQTTFRKVKYLAVASTGPVIEYAYSAGHEDDRTHIHYDEANTLYIVGERLSGAAVKVSYTDSDGDVNIDVPDDRVMAETDGISINGDWLAETLPHGLAADMTFTFTTAEGEASVTLRHE